MDGRAVLAAVLCSGNGSARRSGRRLVFHPGRRRPSPAPALGLIGQANRAAAWRRRVLGANAKRRKINFRRPSGAAQVS